MKVSLNNWTVTGSHAGFWEFGRSMELNANEDVDSKENLFPTRIRQNDIQEEQAVYFELEPGECSLHDSRIIHGATPNKSPYRRCGYTMRYFSADTKVIPEANEGFRIWLARGRDLAGNRYENE